jgi:hypothetical protein
VFGDSILMRFPAGGAPEVDSLARTRYSFENVSCIADSSGELLIYANKNAVYSLQWGQAIGGSLAGWGEITNGTMIVPVWGDDKHYMVFYIAGGVCPFVPCPMLALVSHGTQRDTVVAHYSLGQYTQFNPIAEKIAAVRDAAGTGWWVLCHGIDDDKFIKFKVTGRQVSPFSIQRTGSSHDDIGLNPGSSLGEISFSPQGNRLLLVTYTGIIDVFDFDRCTGTLSNWDSLGTLAPNLPGPDNYYGCSFSADGTKIYVSEGTDSPVLNRIFQFDLTAPDVRGSKTLIYTAPNSVMLGQHQLGPDGKIYITQFHPNDSLNPANFALSVINDPNQVGLACNFSYLSLNLKGRRTTGSLPNLPNYNLPPMVAQVAEAGPQPPMICPGDSVRIGYPDTTNGAVTYRWSPTIGIADSNAASTYVRPDTTRWYYLTALDTAMGLPCGQTIDSVLVTVVPSADIPVVSLGNDTTICPGDSVSLSVGAGSGWEYAWNTGDSTSSVSVNASAIYSVTVTNPTANLHCFLASDSIAVSHFPNPQPLPVDVAGGDTVICNGDSIRLGQSAVAGWNYLWSPSIFLNAANLPQPMAVPLASLDYVLEVRDSISGGACVVLRDTLTLTVEQPFTHPAPEDIHFCIGECFEMGVAPVSGKTYQWSPITGLTSPTASLTRAQPDATTTYTLTVTDPTLQGVNCRTRQFQVVTTADQCQPASFLIANASGTVQVFANIDHHGPVSLQLMDVTGRLVYRNADYQNELSTSTLSSGLYWYSLQIEGDCPVSLGGVLLVQR